MDVHVASRFLALLALTSLAGALALAVTAVRVRLGAGTWPPALEPLRDAALHVAALVATVATAGSLYYSEVVHFVPCQLCWFQRIAMYPLVLVLWLAAFRRDVAIRRYAIPQAVVGVAISAYHYLIQHVPSLGPPTCSAEAPCSSAWVWEFGFVSIPFMAGAGFLLIIALLHSARPEPDEPQRPTTSNTAITTPEAPTPAAR